MDGGDAQMEKRNERQRLIPGTNSNGKYDMSIGRRMVFDSLTNLKPSSSFYPRVSKSGPDQYFPRFSPGRQRYGTLNTRQERIVPHPSGVPQFVHLSKYPRVWFTPPTTENVNSLCPQHVKTNITRSIFRPLIM